MIFTDSKSADIRLEKGTMVRCLHNGKLARITSVSEMPMINGKYRYSLRYVNSYAGGIVLPAEEFKVIS